MEYKIVKLSWSNTFAVMGRSASTGWFYIRKNITEQDAQTLIAELY